MIKQSLTFLMTACLFFATAVQAEQELISEFPLDHYSQTISDWIKPSDADYDTPLLNTDMQQQRMEEFYNHLFGSASPWSSDYVNQILKPAAPDDLKTIELSIIESYSNNNKPENQIGYGENFHPHTQQWINDITKNINLSALANINYHPEQRGIAIDNTHARALPTDDVHFYSHKLAGQGYPFDNLQLSALWAGTPVYILTESRDHAWLLVITPDYIGWVKTNSIARTGDAFVRYWQLYAKEKLAAITQTQTSLVDAKGQYILSAYVGSVFPATASTQGLKLLIPAADANHRAFIKIAIATDDQASLMPLAATPHHFANVMSSMINRPYGWGSMYFYNDCSAETKSLLTPFGIWLPRHSSNQVNIGKMVDLNHLPPSERLSYLINNGRKFLTLVYIGGHVILYVGNYSQGDSHTTMAMTYQNVWGLSPSPATRRAVIGQSVLLPMLLEYPEDKSLISLAGKKYFQVSFLDQLSASASRTMFNLYPLSLRTLMAPASDE